ncbi:MAG: transglutaminase domain-containing protein [Planctomycetota bacterium]
MNTSRSMILFALALCGASCRNSPDAQRRFEFSYETTITDLPAAASQARIWIPVPSSDDAQDVLSIDIDAPIPHRLGRDRVYANQMAYLEISAPFPEEVTIRLTAHVRRRESSSSVTSFGSIDEYRLLAGDQLAPLSAEARERSLAAIDGKHGTNHRALGIYDAVLRGVDYDKSGKGWGKGDLGYVCASGKGNCSDFHSLFIAMSRSAEIPAIFEIGFPIPNASHGTVKGYHCWAWYKEEDGTWRPIDASEADKDPSRSEYFFGTIDADRIAFSRGRDIVLDPAQAGPPVNFLIYPYVEIDGRTKLAKVETQFHFRDR